MTQQRPAVISIAALFSLVVVAVAVSQVLDLVRTGYVSFFGAVLPLLALLIGIVVFWLMHWWGLLVAALAALYVAIVSPLSGLPAMAVMAVFYAPLAVAAVAAHKQFRW